MISYTMALSKKFFYIFGFNEKSVYGCGRNSPFLFLNELDPLYEESDVIEVNQGWLHRSYAYQSIVVVRDLVHGTKSSFTFPEDCLQVKNVSTGWNRIYVVANDGSCWFGELKGTASNTESIKLEKMPTDVVTSAPAKCIDSSGDSMTIVLFEDGLVGEISPQGIVQVPTLDRVQSVACGKEHALLLTTQAKVLSYGLGSRGQLGHGHVEAQQEPTLVEALDGIPIKHISAGGWHSAAVSEYGDAYIWGWNESCQLGFPNKSSQGSKEDVLTIQTIPKLLDFSENVVDIRCGSRHTIALTRDNVLWSWGWNAHGQLGTNNNSAQMPKPVILPTSVTVPFAIQAKHWTSLLSYFS